MKKAIIAGATALSFLATAPAFAMGLRANVLAETNMQTRVNAKTVNVACVQTAVSKREEAIQSAFSAYNTAVSSALSARRSALHSAWAITDTTARREALKSAWTTFRSSWKTADKTFRTARVNAWKQFKTDAKACGGSSDEPSGQSSDNLL